jgi:glutamate dehydrogenase (NAD(P)+)
MESLNSFKIAQEQVEIAGRYLQVDEGVPEMLKRTKREVIVHFPVKMDDGKLRVFTGYRVVHSAARGPAKGAISRPPTPTLIPRSCPGSWIPTASSTVTPFPGWLPENRLNWVAP